MMRGTSNIEPSAFDFEELSHRNDIASRALATYFENAVRPFEEPCEACSGDDELCERGKCPWYDFERCGLWKLRSDENLARAYAESAAPRYPSNPFRYSPVLEEHIVPGKYVSWSSSPHLLDVVDEYEMFASLAYPYGNIHDGDPHLHQHSFDAVVSAMLDDPENFYVPSWARSSYSNQEVLLLEVLRERVCRDNGKSPAVDIVYDDGKGEGLLDSEGSWERRVRHRISEIRGEDDAGKTDK